MKERKAPERGALYLVLRVGEEGSETIEVRAESGDEAAAKASAPGFVVRGVTPKGN
jgi:hypothetical protein